VLGAGEDSLPWLSEHDPIATIKVATAATPKEKRRFTSSE
jgi:hypothetical protein